jgi:L-lysine 6-oxidase
MVSRYAIGPSIGVARLGNSVDQFYLEPDRVGGLPIACDTHGNVLRHSGRPEAVRQFKDKIGRVKRQGAYFQAFAIGDDNSSHELTLDDPNVASMTWTVHLANKKACWYQFAGLEGNLLYGEANSYTAKDVAQRNPNVTSADSRRKLIIDPGPRSVSGRRQHVAINKQTSQGYEFASWPVTALYGELIDSLGDVLTDDAGRLVVLGGFGKSGGDTSITSFAGANTWHDDVSDGPVSCVVKFKNGKVVELNAWCLVGSPKFAPEVVNIVTLDDTMFDTAVRCLNAAPAIFSKGAFNPAYTPNFERDILPILMRPGGYRWVANTPSMNSVSPPPFDPRDRSDATKPLRQAYTKSRRV